MNDFNKPIRPIKRKDADPLKIEPIMEKTDHESFSSMAESHSDGRIFSATCLYLLKQMLNFFIPIDSGIGQLLSLDPLWSDLKQLKEHLIKIRDEDPTDDLKFAEIFAESWNTLLRHYHQNSSHVNIANVHVLIHEFLSYPPAADHSLGFYLKEFGDKNWFPIPFFKILKQLHQEYLAQGGQSSLQLWINQISSLLASS